MFMWNVKNAREGEKEKKKREMNESLKIQHSIHQCGTVYTDHIIFKKNLFNNWSVRNVKVKIWIQIQTIVEKCANNEMWCLSLGICLFLAPYIFLFIFYCVKFSFSTLFKLFSLKSFSIVHFAWVHFPDILKLSYIPLFPLFMIHTKMKCSHFQESNKGNKRIRKIEKNRDKF